MAPLSGKMVGRESLHKEMIIVPMSTRKCLVGPMGAIGTKSEAGRNREVFARPRRKQKL